MRVPLLQLESRPDDWSDWFRMQGIQGEMKNAGNLRDVDRFSMMITCAVQSLGAALLPSYLIENELKEGTLVCLLDARFSTERSYKIVSLQGAKDKSVDAFIAWMRNAVVNGRAPG